MKVKRLILLPLVASTLPSTAVEQILIDWNHQWSYYQVTNGTDPAALYPNFNGTTSAAGAWFAKDSDFAAGYATASARGFGLDAPDASHDSGAGPGPLGYDVMDYFNRTDIPPEFTSFGTFLTQPASGSRFATYFRTNFTLAQDFTEPRIRMLLDDGALIYLDGVLIARVNKGSNTETYNSFGADTTATLNEDGASRNNESTIQAFPLNIAGAGTQADSTVLVAIPKLTAGSHTLAVSCRSNNATSSDMGMALQLRADDAGISAAAVNVTRNDNSTPTDVSDDTYSFDLEVSTINMPGAVGWTSDNLPANGPTAGVYEPTANVYTYTFPAQADNLSPVNTNTITIADSTTPAITATVTVTAPEAPAGPALVLAPATPTFSTGFEQASPGTLNFQRKVFNTELGFTSNAGSGPDANGGTTRPGGVYQDTIVAETNKTWRAVNGACAWTSEFIGLHPSVLGVSVSMKIRTFTTSGTSFETADAISLGVETSLDGITWTLRGNVLPVLHGSPDATAQQNLDRIINLTGPGLSSVNAANYVTLSRSTIPVSGASFVRLRYTNAADLSTSENVLLDDLSISISGINPDADADGDGFSNSAEEEWGSPMNDASSKPGIVTHGLLPGLNPGEQQKSIEIYSGNRFHSYTLLVSDDLGTWTEAITLEGIDDALVINDISTSNHRFFQVRSNY